MYATRTSNSATGYGGIGMMRTGVSPEQMGLKPVDLNGYIPEKASTMYDPATCRREINKQIYRPQQERAPIKMPIGLYPSDFMAGFDIRNTKPFKPEFKQSYN